MKGCARQKPASGAGPDVRPDALVGACGRGGASPIWLCQRSGRNLAVALGVFWQFLETEQGRLAAALS